MGAVWTENFFFSLDRKLVTSLREFLEEFTFVDATAVEATDGTENFNILSKKNVFSKMYRLFISQLSLYILGIMSYVKHSCTILLKRRSS